MKYLFLFMATFWLASAVAQPHITGYKQTTKIINGDTITIEEPVFSPPSCCILIERMPEPGYDVHAFMDKNLIYPAYALKNSIEGRVIVQFVVDEQGFFDSAKIVKSPDTSLNKEALRLINSLPQPWKPGKNRRKPVRVHFTLPVTFRLE